MPAAFTFLLISIYLYIHIDKKDADISNIEIKNINKSSSQVMYISNYLITSLMGTVFCRNALVRQTVPVLGVPLGVCLLHSDLD